MYDIIGDVHGHADELVQLLEQLDYRDVNGRFRHRSRRVIFCGDYIDRGPQIAETLRIVRAMVDCESALAIMGNHEFNAIAWQLPRSSEPGEYYRRHTERHLHQHRETLDQLTDAELADAVEWFGTLPVALDLGIIRVVHACWAPAMIEMLQLAIGRGSANTERFIRDATTPGNPIFDAVECVLKGPEAILPEGVTLVDKDGASRSRTRIRWFEVPGRRPWSEYCLPAQHHPVLQSLTAPRNAQCFPYPVSDPPVFFGHYWLQDPQSVPLAANVACLDYSVARSGRLCAYRFGGERVLNPRRFSSVRTRPRSTSSVVDNQGSDSCR